MNTCVVADTKFNGLLAETPMQVFLPLEQETMRPLAIAARSSVDPGSIAPAIESVVHQIDKDLRCTRRARWMKS